MKGLILSGGKGTRLRPITYTSAKQLLPVANKPILFYAIEAIRDAGITDIGVIVGETAAEIRAAAGDGSRWGVTLTYIPQEAPLGLAHAVKTARPFLGIEPFVMYLGDNLLQGGVAGLVRDFQVQTPDALVLLTPVPNPGSFGVAELDASGRIVSLEEKPEKPATDLALVGVYLFNPSIHKAIDEIRPSRRGELEITDAIRVLIESGRRVESRIHEGWWLDTGKKDDLLAANRVVLREVAPEFQGEADSATRMEGTVRAGQGTRIRGSLLRGPVVIGANCEIEGSIIGPNCSIGDGTVLREAEIEDSVVLENCRILGPMALIANSLIGRNVIVEGKPGPPQALHLLLGDDSHIRLA